MLAKDKIFREYDIRGVVGEDFNAEFAKALGLAYGGIIRETFATPSRVPTVAVGRDCRLSGPELAGALIEGIRSAGINVVSSGCGPTPQLYFTVFNRDLDGGIQVTASHNPSDQNGFKLMVGKKTLSGESIQDLKRRVQAGPVMHSARGALEEWPAEQPYLQELIERSKSQIGPRKIKVVVDAGNGVGGPVGPALLRALGCEVIELFTEQDGRFPNHHPDPTVLDNIVVLRETVKKENADFGIGWDGDADRIGVVDENAEPIFGDMLLVIFGRQLIKEVNSPTIIGDVKCSELMFSDLRSKGANAVMWKTGHSLIKAKLQELNGALAGEMSGHIFFKHRFFGFDDALHASARLVEIVSNFDGPVSKLLEGIPKTYTTPEIRVECPETIKFKIAEAAKRAFPEYTSSDIDGIRVNFEKGWGLVRASNTQAALVMRFEAESPELLKQYQSLVESRIDQLSKSLS